MTAWVSGGAAAQASEKDGKQPSSFTVWRLLRWIFLLVLVLVIVQMMRRPAPPPALARTPQERAADAASFRNKLDALQRAHSEGMPGVPAHFTEDELNGYIQQSVAESLAPPSGGASPDGVASGNVPAGAVPTNEEAQAAVAGMMKAVKAPAVTLAGDQISVQMTVERFGKEFTFSLSGKLGSEDGYVTFHPTSCKLGLMTVPLALVDGLVQKKLAEPENREKMKLPDFIQSVRVENGELVVVEK